MKIQMVFSRWLVSLALLAGLTGPLATAQPAAAAAPAPARPAGSNEFEVDRDDDSNSAAAKVCSDGADNDCTLRGAIELVNALGTVDNAIVIDVDVETIALVSPLPAITRPGTLVTGLGSTPQVDALNVTGGDVFTINGDDVQINNLSIVNGPSSGGWADIRVIGGLGATISNNFLGLGSGVGPGGCTPTGVIDNSVYGVVVTGTVGASGAGNGTYITGNTIVCHSSHAVAVFGSDYVYVGQTGAGGSAGNFIGVSAGGAWLPNDGDGVAFLALGGNGVRHGVIRGNTIAGNNGHGVSLVGTGTNNTSSTYNNVVRGNRIGLDGIGALGNGGDGVRLITGAYLNQIGGTTTAERNIISGNDGSGVFIANANGNGVLGNYIGTDLAGGGTTFGNDLHGVSITGGDANIIGGYLPLLVLVTAPNVIANNAGNGIDLIGSAAAAEAGPSGFSLANTLIIGNHIGTDPGGTLDRGNTGSGIAIEDVVTGVITGNVVSGNGSYGIYLLNSEQISITANRVGTNAAGSAALQNAIDGIALTSGSNSNAVGGNQAGAGNTVSGNQQCGVKITGSTGNLVSSNTLGLNLARTAPVPNGQAGMCLTNADNNVIGAASLAYPQLIAGNLTHGVQIAGGSDNNYVGLSNFIGVAGDLYSAAGNGGHGVLIQDSSGSVVSATMVMNNGGAGLAVTGNGSANNQLAVQHVRDNGGLPIDLGNNGHTPNDAGDVDSGPNGLLNYPEIELSSGTVYTITACTSCGVRLYQAVGNPAGPGGGGALTGPLAPNGSGQWVVNFIGPQPPYFTLQAFDGSGNSSEFSPRPFTLVFLPLAMK